MIITSTHHGHQNLRTSLTTLRTFTNLFTFEVQMQVAYGGFTQQLTKLEHLVPSKTSINDGHSLEQWDIAKTEGVILRSKYIKFQYCEFW